MSEAINDIIIEYSSNATIPDICDASRATISPDGSYVTFWTSADDRAMRGQIPRYGDVALSIATTSCLWKEREDCVVRRAISRAPFRSFTWSVDGSAVAVLNGGLLARWRPEDEIIQVEDLGLTTDTSKIVIQGLPTEDQLSSLSNSSPIPPSFRLGPLYAWGGRWFGALLDRRSHNLALTDSLTEYREIRSINVSAHFVNEKSTIASNIDGRAYLVGGGAFHEMNEGSLLPVFPELANPEPIFDASSGGVLGAFDDEQVRWLDNDQGWPIINQAERISSVSFHSKTGTFVSISQGKSAPLIEIREGSRIQTISCLDTGGVPTSSLSNKRDQYNVRPIENWGSANRPLFARRYETSNDRLGVVLAWQGGPGSSFTRGQQPSDDTLAWLARGYDVILFDGTGAAGLESGLRLRAEGVAGQLRDAQIVAARVAIDHSGTAQIVVQGTSFGAIAAAENAAELARIRGTSDNISLLLRSPWLTYRSPKETRGSRLFPLNENFARRSELSRFGPIEGEDGYASDMEHWKRTYSWQGKFMALFHEQDQISTPIDLWGRGSTNNNYILLPGRHGSINGEEMAINDWLSDT